LVGSYGLRHPEGELAALKDSQDRSLSAMITAGLLVFVASMAVYNTQSGGQVAQVEKAVESGGGSSAYGQLMEKALGPVALRGDEALLGDPNAPYTVVEFADFECPACAQVTPLVHELVARNPQVKVVFKHYPLSNICNSNIGREFHLNACRAAYAAECARQQGRFWDLTHLMMKNQTELDPDGINFMAGQVGLDIPTLTACMESPDTQERIRQDIAAATTAGVEGTPALFMKGTHGDEWVSLTAGPEGGELLLRAHLAGKELPAVPPARSHEGHGH
jgi:protein-disulfide isomerase